MNKWLSKRAGAMPGSIFHRMDQAMREAKTTGKTIVDLSIGSSDLQPPQSALEALKLSVDDAATYGYCLHSCSAPLRRAVASWFIERYQQPINAEREVLGLIGSQEGLANLLLAVADPADLILMPNPCYPSYYGAVALAGLETYTMPLFAEQQFLPDLSAIPSEVASRARAMILSYPNNPTAAVASVEYFAQVVDFCLAYEVLLIHDFPYVDMVFGGYEAPSVLTQPRAMEVAVELYSASKSFHMGGFRIGWAAGNADVIEALRQVKSAIDFNQYLGIQRAAIAALEVPRAAIKADAKVFESRRNVVVEQLREAGWDVAMPKASMYVWARLPSDEPSLDLALQIVRHTGVALSPGSAFGDAGEGYVRIALVREPRVLKEAMAAVTSFFSGEKQT